MSIFHPPRGPVATYLGAVLAAHAERLRQARRDGERGASAVELAIITGFLVLLIIGIVIVITKVVTTAKTNIQTTVPNP
jgi:Flp pilus assembly pilin Flp